MAPASYKRTAHRWRLLLLMLFAVFCALGSFWLVQVMQGEDNAHGINAGNEPDYIVDNFSWVRMSEAGKPRYVISGERLTHRPVDNTALIDKPVVQSLTDEHPPMTMTSNSALVSQNQNQIDLTGNVDIRRPAAPGAEPMRIRTEVLTILPDDEIAKTDKPIRMTLGSASVDAVGMVANNATQQIALGGRGKVAYPPHQSRASPQVSH
jgi:lipopolysaccharide export system protein LptC